jgi:hypothetical protein
LQWQNIDPQQFYNNNNNNGKKNWSKRTLAPMSQQPHFCFVAEANRIRISKQLRTPTKTSLTWGKGDKALEQEWSTMEQAFTWLTKTHYVTI